MDRSPRGNDIITLRFFDFRNSRFFLEFHQNPQTRYCSGLAPRILPPAGAKIAHFAKVACRVELFALFGTSQQTLRPRSAF